MSQRRGVTRRVAECASRGRCDGVPAVSAAEVALVAEDSVPRCRADGAAGEPLTGRPEGWTRAYRGTLGHTGVHWVIQGHTGVHWDIQGYTGSYRGTLRHTEEYSSEYTGSYREIQGYTGAGIQGLWLPRHLDIS